MIIEANDYESAFIEAESYLSASNYLIDSACGKIQFSETKRFLGVHFASLVNHTLAIEMYFKCLSIITQTNYKNGHILRHLFYNLKKKVQQKLENCYEEKYMEQDFDLLTEMHDCPKKTFAQLINIIPQPFAEFRYTFENKVYGKKEYRLDYITLTLKDVIFEYHPELNV